MRLVSNLSMLEIHPLDKTSMEFVTNGNIQSKSKKSSIMGTSSGGSGTYEAGYDFWGPFSVVSMFGLLLWLGSGRSDVSWVYVVWSGAACLLHLIARVWYNESSFSLHFAILGYSLTPMIFPFSCFILLVRPVRWVTIVLELMAVTMSSLAAVSSYHHLCHFTTAEQTRAGLIVVPIFLTHMYFMSLLPIDTL